MGRLTQYIGKVLGLADGQFWSAYYGGETWAGKQVNETSAMNLSAWWRGVRLYADITGAMPCKMFERTKGNEREQVRDHPVAIAVGNTPNPDQTAQEYWSNMAAGLAMFGNCYSEKLFSGKTIFGITPLPYGTLPDRSRSSDLEYQYQEKGKTIWLPRDRVVHTKGFSIGKSDLGLSPLGAARQSLSISTATEESAGKVFSQGLRASGFFTGPRLTETQRQQFTEKFINPIIGNDAKNHYGILESGFGFTPVNINPHDAEMLLSRHFNVEELCRFMGIPPILVGHASAGQTMWGSGVESIINAWLILGLDAHLSRLEKSAARWLLTTEERQRFYLEFDRDVLMRADSAARATFLAQMIQNGLMMPNEGRAKMNLPPGEGGDQLLVNGTLVPLKTVRAAPLPAVAKELAT